MFPHRRHQDDDEVPPSSDNVMGDYGSQKDDYGGDYGSKGDYDQQDTQSGYQGRVKKEDYGEDYGGQGDYGTQGVKSGYQGGNTEQEEYGGDYGSKAKYGSQDTDQDASDYGGSKKADYGGDYENQQDAQSGYLQSNTKQQSFTDDTGDYTTTEATTTFGDTNEDEAEAVSKEKVQHGHFEHLAEGGTLAAGAFALYEKHEAKKDPEHAGRHRIEEEVAGAAAVGGALFGFHEHHEKKKSEDEEEELEGTKKHGWFG